MPHSPFGAIPEEEQAERLAALRRARDGDLLARHIVLWCAAGRHPTAIAAVLFCSRSSVYRTGRADQDGSRGWEPDAPGRLRPPVRPTVLLPMRQRSLLARLKAPPRAYGGCRTRWSGAPLALTWQAKRGGTVSAETRRRWGHEVGWVWKRARLVATDDDPPGVERLARSRLCFEHRKDGEAMVCADALARHVWPNVGGAWMPTGAPREVMTPGQHHKASVAGALELATGSRRHGRGPRQTHALCRDRLGHLEAHDPAAQSPRVDVGVDHDKSHPAQAVEPWLAAHPRLTRLLLPTSGPRANPLARVFGDVHAGCTRNHRRTRVPALVTEVEDQGPLNGPWKDTRSDLYDEPLVTAAVANLASEAHTKVAV